IAVHVGDKDGTGPAAGAGAAESSAAAECAVAIAEDKLGGDSHHHCVHPAVLVKVAQTDVGSAKKGAGRLRGLESTVAVSQEDKQVGGSAVGHHQVKLTRGIHVRS